MCRGRSACCPLAPRQPRVGSRATVPDENRWDCRATHRHCRLTASMPDRAPPPIRRRAPRLCRPHWSSTARGRVGRAQRPRRVEGSPHPAKGHRPRITCPLATGSGSYGGPRRRQFEAYAGIGTYDPTYLINPALHPFPGPRQVVATNRPHDARPRAPHSGQQGRGSLGPVSQKGFEPGEDGGEDDAGAVGDGVLVVSGGQSAPLLVDVEGAFDDVAAFVEPVSRMGGRPPELPRFLRWRIWSSRSGITTLIPRAVSFSRCSRAQYAVSASSASGRVRGRPANGRGTRSPSSRWGSIGESPACPGPIRRLRGRPAPSTSWWILVDSPPRDRPMPWSGGSMPRLL